MPKKTATVEAPRVPYWQRQQVDPAVPCVLVLAEKHGTVYMPAANDEELFRSALSVLKGRMKGNWYGTVEEWEKDSTYYKKPELTVEQAEALPKGEIRKAALNQWLNYTRDQQDRQQVVDFLKSAAKVIEEKNGQVAWRLLKERDGGEYEGVRLERLSTSYGRDD